MYSCSTGVIYRKYIRMKISYNWLKQFLPILPSPEKLSTILTDIGLEVEHLEKVQLIPGGLDGLLIGYVTACSQHPNADKLSITKVDLGCGEPVQIVCGAANVAAGQKVVVAPVGATVHPTTGEPFKIGKAKIRGEVSEGMICAEDEIGLGTSHEGIMVLANDAPVGTQAKDYFKIEEEYVFEIGLTPNRADAVSHLGVARDVLAWLKTHENCTDDLTLPSINTFKQGTVTLPISIAVENTEACPRYAGVCISGITVADSPEWLQNRLKAIGLKPINNVVDTTNYVMHELGQPLHAFDYNKIEDAKVVVKTVAEGTKFTTLEGTERKLSAQDLMICNGKGEAMCIAGVFGGLASGVTASTQNIFLESAYFNPVWVRKTAKRHALKTDASFRFERGTDPNMPVFALKRAALLITEIAGGTIASKVIDAYPNPVPHFEIKVAYTTIHKLIGQVLPQKKIQTIITSLGITLQKTTEEEMYLQVPPYKVDVTRDVDIVEEILRIYGYNAIEFPKKITSSLVVAPKPDNEKIKHAIADMLTSNGFSEMMNNSLTKSTYAKLLGEQTQKESVAILNPLSSDLDVMRQTLLFSALETVAYNINRKQSNLKLYEFGKTYHLQAEKYSEKQQLAIVITGSKENEQWNAIAGGADYFTLKGTVESILTKLGITDTAVVPYTDTIYAEATAIERNGKQLATIGKLANSVRKVCSISEDVFYANINWDEVLKVMRKAKPLQYQEISKFPAVRRDLSMLIDAQLSFEQLRAIAVQTEKQLLKEVQVFDVYQGDKLPKGKRSYALSFVLEDNEKTLTDKQIDSVMDRLIQNFEKAGAEVRKQ